MPLPTYAAMESRLPEKSIKRKTGGGKGEGGMAPQQGAQLIFPTQCLDTHLGGEFFC